MIKGNLYGLGIGPGAQTALQIVKEYVEGKQLRCCTMPMVRAKQRFNRRYEEIADPIRGLEDSVEIWANRKAGSGVLQLGKRKNTSMVENCGVEGRKAWNHLSDVTENSGYFSVVVQAGA